MKRLVIVILGSMLIFGVIGVAAQVGGGYDLTWYTIDSGGGASGTGGYIMNGTIGQADVATWNGGGYLLSGGFWYSDVALQQRIYLPLVLKNA